MTSFMKPSPHLLVPLFGKNYWKKVYLMDLGNLVLYHRMNEASGGTAIDRSPEGNDGAYTGVTLGETGIGDGLTCPLFDGANDLNNIYSAGLNGDFDGQEGSIAIWGKVSGAGVWTDGTSDYLANIEVDASNYVWLYKSTANDRLQLTYKAGGTADNVLKNGISETGWFHLAATWSLTADEFKFYYNGSQEGLTQTGLGTWAGNLHVSRCNVGCQRSGPTNPWNGWLAHAAVWKSVLSDDQIAKLAAV